jgi:anthranilate phosphoribosyltransferase
MNTPPNDRSSSPVILLGRLAAGEDLTLEEMQDAIRAIMHGAWQEQEIALFLTSLRAKGETVDEVAGAALAMREVMTPIQTGRPLVVDTCGTGGSGMNLFNISTAAALVTAAVGVPVAKHGNRGISSKSGSADVLAELGVRIDAPIERVEACLDELGICFCFAPLFHQSMKHVASVRRALGIPTVFNVLGPLCNPARAPFQLIGVGKAEHRPLLAEALTKLGTRRALVVHGADGLDEITVDGATWVSEVNEGRVMEHCWTPADFGLAPSSTASFRVEGPGQSATLIRQVLAGETGPARDIVLINSAAALWVSGHCDQLSHGVTEAARAIDSGAAGALLAKLVAFFQA